MAVLMKNLKPGVGILLAVFFVILGLTTQVARGVDINRVGQVAFSSYLFLYVLLYWFLIDSVGSFLNRIIPRYILMRIVYLIINLFIIAAFAYFASHLQRYYGLITGSRPFFATFYRYTIVAIIVTVVKVALIYSDKFQKLQNENLKARFDLLTDQINPHFLFNSLSVARTMVRENDPNTENFIVHLSKVYRKLLENKESVILTVKEELEFLESYLFMMKERYEDKLSVEINIPDKVKEKSLPAFSLHLLVENCLKHNIISNSKPLSIQIKFEEPEWIAVENNLQPKKNPDESTGIGVANMLKRYELSGIHNGLLIEETENSYTAKLKLIDGWIY